MPKADAGIVGAVGYAGAGAVGSVPIAHAHLFLDRLNTCMLLYSRQTILQ